MLSPFHSCLICCYVDGLLPKKVLVVGNEGEKGRCQKVCTSCLWS